MFVLLPLLLQAALVPARRLPIKNLVTFGDSYSDVVNIAQFPGGTAWPVYAAGYGHYSLFPFAHSGATCSNALTPRPFPGVFENELPEYFNSTKHGSILNPAETLYTLWIGTNDVGVGALLTGQATPGVSIVDTTACAVNWVKTLYQSGARNFLFQNMIPLDRVPLYAADSYPNRYWTAQRNTTEWNVFMKELVSAGNLISKLMLSELAPRLHGAHVGLFDSHALFTDIINNPAHYLNGTAPLNVTGSTHACVFNLNERTSDPGRCTDASGSDRDSFVWFDELHPSEQADRIVARELVSAVNGSMNNGQHGSAEGKKIPAKNRQGKIIISEVSLKSTDSITIQAAECYSSSFTIHCLSFDLLVAKIQFTITRRSNNDKQIQYIICTEFFSMTTAGSMPRKCSTPPRASVPIGSEKL